MNRTALLLSAVVTAFVLVLIGGIAGRLAAAPAAPQDQAASLPVEAPVQAPIVAPTEAVASASDTTVAEAAAPEAATEIDARTAARLALTYASGATLLRWPELVDLQGARAYEVLLDQGTIYIDAATGTVLYDARPTTNTQAGQTGGEHEQHESAEQEHGDDD